MKNSSVALVVTAIVLMGIALVWKELAGKPSQVASSSRHQGCACAATPAHATKFLIFWKDKEEQVFKVSDRLFDSVQEAWKTVVPPNAAEVRIITVRID